MLRLTFIIIFAALFLSCRKNNMEENHMLHFSSDTVFFDTVFASVGSATKEVRVINRGSQKIVIDEIYLAGGSESQFRLNIDGEPGNLRKDVEIDGGDSIFIFVDVDVDPADSNSPVAVSDSIMFKTGSDIDKVQLLAWGQDINLIDNRIIGTQTWNRNKPYVVYGDAFVDTAATLTIDSGSRVLFHRNGSMKVAGSLIVRGTYAFPVLFSSDRVEKIYEDIPGQWLGVSFLNTSQGSRIDHAIVRNSTYGLAVGELPPGANEPDLLVTNTSVMHSTVSCLTSLDGKVTLANTILAHTGKYCINISAGGEYRLIHCTLFNIWDYGFRLTPAVSISEKSGPKATPVSFEMDNCVLYGNLESELSIEPAGTVVTGSYYFDHCLLRLDTINSSVWSKELFPAAIINKDPRFISTSDYDFRPDTLSPLINAGKPVYGIDYPYDYRGVSRLNDGLPDIGAFERKPGEHKQ